MTNGHCSCRLCEHDSANRWHGWIVILAALAGLLMFAPLAIGDELKPGAPPASVVVIGGCSGVNVDPAGLILTAKHCQHESRERIEFVDGRSVMGHKVYESDQTDGPVAFMLDDPGPFPTSQVAGDAPAVGEKVYSWGYPAGSQSHARNLSYASGVVTGMEKVPAVTVGLPPLLPAYNANVVSKIAIDGGWSGGPLFNAKGEVIGLASASNDKKSFWLGFTVTRDAYRIGMASVTPAQPREVTFYTQPHCYPCEQFKLDYAAGRFPGYSFNAGDMATVDWVTGTPAFEYRGDKRQGYDGGPSALLAWLSAHETPEVYSRPPPDVVLGNPAPIPDPQPQPTPAPGVTPWKRPVEEVSALKAQVETLIADVKKFQDAGVIGKTAMIGTLKDDVSNLKESTAVARSEFESAREDWKKAKDDGHPWWYGAPAVILGIIKRRYLNRGVVAEV